MAALLGVKAGMTRLFAENGRSNPVTVIDVSGNRVCQVKTAERDGYAAVQLAQGQGRRTRFTRARIGHLGKHNAGAARRLREYRASSEEISGLQPGQELAVDALFAVGHHVDVTSRSKGCGFAGVIKRHNFSSGRQTHGNSRAHRKPGSTGQNQDPGRVFPGKKMPGQMGSRRTTVQNLKVIRVDGERGLLFVIGAVPGPRNADVMVRHAVKKPAAAPVAGSGKEGEK